MFEGRRILGIMGGLGPMATTYFMERIVEMTDASEDQDNISMIVYNCPYIPDRTKHILDPKAPDPTIAMIDIARRIQNDGADGIAVPCITAQYYHDYIQKEVAIPVMNGVQETVQFLKSTNVDRVGLLATNGTIDSNIFGKALEEAGVSYCYPSEQDQKSIMSIIYEQIKAGKRANVNLLVELGDRLKKQGVERVILGCTELSVIKRHALLPDYFLDVIDVMARYCVKDYAKLRKEFETI